MQIAVILIALALYVAAAVRLRDSRRSRYPARPRPPYATFHDDGQAPQLLECEGPCTGATVHEHAGDGTATCITCGTPRALPTTAA